MTCTLLALSFSLIAGCGDDAPVVAAIPSTPLTAVQTPKPDYPIELACANIGGTAVFNVVVGIEGKPVEVKLLASSGQAKLDASAEAAVRTWIFEAATRNGKPVVQGLQVPVRFTPPAERPSQCFALDAQS
ncbi:MAG TPA: TonB family protein [Pseudoxanthomonas sp.]|nr:TonB family protein [Pseudoxanthomonas sp.]